MTYLRNIWRRHLRRAILGRTITEGNVTATITAVETSNDGRVHVLAAGSWRKWETP